MARSDEEEPSRAEPPPAKKSPHQLGEALDTLSVAELDDRILLLHAEIGRLEAQRAAKEESRRAANAFFKN